MTGEAREHSFDELTRGLASGSISRGRALRLIGAALVGGTLASIPGTAWGSSLRATARSVKETLGTSVDVPPSKALA